MFIICVGTTIVVLMHICVLFCEMMIDCSVATPVAPVMVRAPPPAQATVTPTTDWVAAAGVFIVPVR